MKTIEIIGATSIAEARAAVDAAVSAAADRVAESERWLDVGVIRTRARVTINAERIRVVCGEHGIVTGQKSFSART